MKRLYRDSIIISDQLWELGMRQNDDKECGTVGNKKERKKQEDCVKESREKQKKSKKIGEKQKNTRRKNFKISKDFVSLENNSQN